MRKLILFALLGTFGGTVALTLPVQTAHAKPAADEVAFDIEIVETGSAPLDSIFDKSQQPIETVASLRDEIRGVKGKLVESLGLTQGTPFKDALADLQKKSEDKINVSFADKKWPTFEVQEGVPENVRASVATLNSSLTELFAARDKLKEAGAVLEQIADEASELAAEPSNLALKATAVPKAVLRSKKNVKALRGGVVVTKDLLTELKGLVKDVKAVFVAGDVEEDDTEDDE